MTNCAESVDDYEKSLGIDIIGLKRVDSGEVSYAMMMKRGTVEMVLSSEVKKLWPEKLKTFLVKRITFPEKNRIFTAQYNNDNVETKAFTLLDKDPPSKILGNYRNYSLLLPMQCVAIGQYVVFRRICAFYIVLHC